MTAGAPVDPGRRDRLIEVLREAGIADERVLAAIARVPRERFVPPTFLEHAYENVALPIGHGQTVSQPQIVAMMTEALAVGERMKVLEIGTGSGYQTAVLAKLCRRIYTIERHRPLLREAEKLLSALRLHNITTLHGDGSRGWREQAPFDRIIVTAAAEDAVPPPLIEQLAVDGIMVIPVARSAVDQRMLRVVRRDDGVEVEDMGPVRFVPLVSEHDDHPPQTVSRAIARLRRRR
jgi:protein-L-isoaspartate(D-aspartate) O-methyltransferase